MQCGVCELDKARLYCTQCGQASLWNLRTAYLFTATERDAASDRVEEHLESGPALMVNTACKEHILENSRRLREEKEKLQERNSQARNRIETFKRELEERRRRFEEHRELARKQDTVRETLEREIRRTTQKHRVLAQRTAEARSFLCREAAGLYSLRIKKRRSGRVEYLIGGVPIPHLLQDLNAHGVTSINTSLASISHLLMLVAHYLGLKLPYDINLPGKGSPHPTIQGVHHARHITIRQLYLEKTLAELAVENTAVHTKFVEAVSMLAMNIAYLCYAQGLELNEVDEACNIGYNMWKLLAARDCIAATNPTFGRLSNATAFGNTSTAQGRGVMAKFKVGYKMIVEKIRYTLQGETIVADWDFVSDPDADQDEFKPSVKTDGQGRIQEGEINITPSSTPVRRSSSGGGAFDRWTRVRSRNDSRS